MVVFAFAWVRRVTQQRKVFRYPSWLRCGEVYDICIYLGAYIKDPRVAEILSIQAKTNNMHEDKPYNIELSESDDEDTEGTS